MDLNDVHAFLKVVEQGGFSAAARAIGVPTSTVSRRVARLEDELGVRLLQRTTRKHSLTDAGRIFHARSAHVVEDLEDAERALAEMHATVQGHLRLTFPEDTGGQMWPILATFLSQYPEVTVEALAAQRYVDLVGEGYDVALRAGQLQDGRLIARKLAQVDQILVASPAYLEARGTPTRVADLADHDCVVFPAWAPKGEWTLNCVDGPQTVPIRGRVTVNNLPLITEACLSGFGIGRTVRVRTQPHLTAGTLREVLPGTCPQQSPMSLVYPSRRHLAPVVRAFLDHVVEHWEPR